MGADCGVGSAQYMKKCEIAGSANTIEVADALKILVFESANPDYFIAHYDMQRLTNRAKDGGFHVEDTHHRAIRTKGSVH